MRVPLADRLTDGVARLRGADPYLLDVAVAAAVAEPLAVPFSRTPD